MPAHAEIIVEGEVNLEDLFDEEEIIAATMYALPKKQKLPELNVTAITMRADRPIYRKPCPTPTTRPCPAVPRGGADFERAWPKDWGKVALADYLDQVG